MIIDQLNVFLSGDEVTAGSESKVIKLAGSYAGRGEPINISVAPDGVTGISLDFQEADDLEGEFTNVASFEFTEENFNPTAGFIVPRNAKKPYVKVAITSLVGTPGKGFFIGVTRDNPGTYSKGQYIDKGKVVA